MMDGTPQVGDYTIAQKGIDLLEGLLEWRPQIEKALKNADWSHTFDDLTNMVIHGQLEFHEFDDCFCFTQQTVFPQFKTYHFMVAGGNMDSIIEKTEIFKNKARALGCRYLSFSGRKGFEPVLRKEGWTHRFTTMWLEVGE
ncbi:MAG: hypothetical protein QNJ16_20705 [Rhodobacter sp.]|nr:hypothetical protein [Rhodobacter sp.]